MPKLTSLTLSYLNTNLRDFTFPSLTQFNVATGDISVRDLTSFFGRCPLLELIRLRLSCLVHPLTHPPRRRVCLPALKELRLNQSACVTGLLDHLILPKCTEMVLKGQFSGKILDEHGEPAARIHPSSIDYLPVTRGITKAVAMPLSCTLSGPNGNLAFWCFYGTREHFDADFFTSFSPISVLQIKELWIGQESEFGRGVPWKQTAAGVQGAFEVLTKVEDLTIVSCETGPVFATLGATVDGGILLPRLQNLTIYVGCGDLDVPSLIQCAKARGEHFQPLKKVTVVWERGPGANVMREVESIREFVGELIHGVGETPGLVWRGKLEPVHEF